MLLSALYSVIVLPLLGAVFAGLFNTKVSQNNTHRVVIAFLSIAFLGAGALFYHQVFLHDSPIISNLYVWLNTDHEQFTVSFLLDKLSATMLVVVTFVALMVCIYSIEYMKNDPGYQRFFGYLSFFTFAMLLLVLANNFLVLFVGWEAVGLASYWLIGFWFEKPSANGASYKAFCVNRLGDFSFILGVALIFIYCGKLDYQALFQNIPILHKTMIALPGLGYHISLLTLICLLLFGGAMAKSAQIPLHIWLPDSMAGPTPVSALIHAATMVTAGIYLVARLSPLFEFSLTARVVVLIIGASTCLFLGLVALVENDIKRIIAYSTLSQLGYMVVALGISAYDAAIFHLMMHAFFKALLFLAAGSVILAMHHEQDIRKMGGLLRYLPFTYLAFVGATVSMIAVPPFSGFYSKDVIIQATSLALLPGARYAYCCVQLGALVTVLYSLRLIILVFHGKPNWLDFEHKNLPCENNWRIVLPLMVLLIPSIGAGAVLVGPMLFNTTRLLGSSVFTTHDILAYLALDYHGPYQMALAAYHELTFMLVLFGMLTIALCYIFYPNLPLILCRSLPNLYRILSYKYGFDHFNQMILVRGFNTAGRFLYQIADLKIIDGFLVEGSARLMQRLSQLMRGWHTGYMYHYVFTLLLGLGFFLIYCVLC